MPVQMYLEVEGPKPPGGLDDAMFAFLREHLQEKAAGSPGGKAARSKQR